MQLIIFKNLSISLEKFRLHKMQPKYISPTPGLINGALVFLCLNACLSTVDMNYYLKYLARHIAVLYLFALLDSFAKQIQYKPYYIFGAVSTYLYILARSKK